MAVTLPHTIAVGTPRTGERVQANDEALRDYINGDITNAEIDAAAAIAYSKLNLALSIVAGDLATAAVTSPKLAPTTGLVTGSSNLTLGTTAADVVGATVGITPSVASTLLVTAAFNFDVSSTPCEAIGYLVVDGSAQTPVAVFEPPGAEAATVPQVFRVSLTAAAHTIKLQAKRVAGAGTCVAANTQFLYVLHAQ